MFCFGTIIFHYFTIILILFKLLSLLQKKIYDLGSNSLQKSGALRFLEGSALVEIRAKGFAGGRAAREASLRGAHRRVDGCLHGPEIS